MSVADEMQKDWDNWYSDYEIYDYLEKTDENWEKVQQMDPELVWTDHSTCDQDRITNGPNQFGGCCWDTYGWYIGKKSWAAGGEDFITIISTAYLPCEICNLNDESEYDEYPQDCECEGEGFVQHFFD